MIVERTPKGEYRWLPLLPPWTTNRPFCTTSIGHSEERHDCHRFASHRRDDSLPASRTRRRRLGSIHRVTPPIGAAPSATYLRPGEIGNHESDLLRTRWVSLPCWTPHRRLVRRIGDCGPSRPL